MKKKAVIITQETLIKCDNPTCDYVVSRGPEHGEVEDISVYEEYLNKPCPKCGENLLTEEDYKDTKKLFNIVKLFNTHFGRDHKPTKEEITGRGVPVNVKVHKGFHIDFPEKD